MDDLQAKFTHFALIHLGKEIRLSGRLSQNQKALDLIRKKLEPLQRTLVELIAEDRRIKICISEECVEHDEAVSVRSNLRQLIKNKGKLREQWQQGDSLEAIVNDFWVREEEKEGDLDELDELDDRIIRFPGRRAGQGYAGEQDE